MDNFFFINIPKTAGTFVAKRLVNKNDNVEYLGHPKCISDDFVKSHLKDNSNYDVENWLSTSDSTFGVNYTVSEKNKDSIKFTIIRNPYDLLSSYFVSRWGDWDAGFKDKLSKKNFNGLVEEFCDLNSNWHIPFFRDFLYFQLFDDNGNSKCDYAIIYDDLENGLNEFSKKNNLSFNGGGRENYTSNKSKNYKEYYNDKTIEMIKNKCKLELEMFNFDFNGYQGSETIIDMSNFKVDMNKIYNKTHS